MTIQPTNILSALKSSDSKFHVYKDEFEEWRWRLVSSNGKIIATSGEGYRAKKSCTDGIDLVKASINADVVED